MAAAGKAGDDEPDNQERGSQAVHRVLRILRSWKDDDATLSLTEIAQRNGISLQQLPQALQAQGIDYAAYRDSMRRELTLRLLQQRDVVARITVTPREIDTYLERQSKHPSASAEFNVSHILIAVPQEATTAQLEAAQKKAGMQSRTGGIHILRHTFCSHLAMRSAPAKACMARSSQHLIRYAPFAERPCSAQKQRVPLQARPWPQPSTVPKTFC